MPTTANYYFPLFCFSHHVIPLYFLSQQELVRCEGSIPCTNKQCWCIEQCHRIAKGTLNCKMYSNFTTFLKESSSSLNVFITLYIKICGNRNTYTFVMIWSKEPKISASNTVKKTWIKVGTIWSCNEESSAYI